MEPIDRVFIMKALTSSEGQAAIKAMTGTDAYAYFLALVCSAPTIAAAPVVHSQWEEDVNAWIRCPECGFEQDIDCFGEHPHEIDGYKVCPSCGARMGGEGDG